MLQLFVAVILIIGGFVGGIYYYRQNDAWNLKEVAYCQDTYLRKQGSTVFLKGAEKSYDLRSFDGGKAWYAVDQLSDGSLKILGLSDIVYPGLLQHLHGFDALVNYTKEHGPLTFTGERAVTDQKLAEASGFTVEFK